MLRAFCYAARRCVSRFDVEFIDENGRGVGVRLRERRQKKT
jgi:hypothetical protein